MPRRLNPEDVAKLHDLKTKGYSYAEIARRTGVAYNTVRRQDFAQRPKSTLKPEAQRALEDFGYYRQRYLGRVTLPWHIQFAKKVVELLATDQREYLVVNVPPGAGKSTTLTDLCCWMLTRDRSTRILYGSAVQSVASDYTRRIMNDLTRTDTYQASSRDAALGLAVDAVATLEADFGRFKPADGDRWTKEKFVVAQEAGRKAQEKEASVVAYGFDSQFLGGRFDLNIWDDLVTDKTMRTEDAREKLINWWENTAETRCEPGGLVVLNGQRLGGDDLYRYALDLVGGDDFEPHTLDELPPEEQPRKYHHVVFPAHDDAHCKGATVPVDGKDVPNPDHATTAAPWPEGCLLDPKRLSWRFLAPIRANKAQKFETVYQQRDIDAANSLVQQIWIDGGTDADGITYAGCKNRERMMWQTPRGMTGLTTCYLTVDPSPTKNWSVQYWIYHHLSEKRILLAHYRGPMDSPDFLDFDLLTQSYIGLADEWWQRGKDLGYPFTHVIVENNAAQKFMLQADFINKWSAQRHVQLIPHATHKNKSDPDYGVQMLAPLYKGGLIDLPFSGIDALKQSGYLISEVTKWPNGAFEDCVMSQWFGEHNLVKIKNPGARIYRMRPDDYLSRKAKRGLSA